MILNTCSTTDDPSIAIFLATFNGEKYLSEQLDSIERQTHQNWVLYASDDGSSDKTLEILQTYAERWGEQKLVIRRGSRQGLCCNFMSMVLDPTIRADYYALCDQDDVWLEEKLSRAVSCLQEGAWRKSPLLYCSRTQYVSENLAHLGLSRDYTYPTGFKNALVQNLAGGNTMLFNQAAKDVAIQAGVSCAVLHDWWLYLLVTGVGGQVVFDKSSFILYRQHQASTIGKANSTWDKLKRLKNLISGQHKRYAEIHIQALNQSRHCLSDESLVTLSLFESLHTSKSLLQRISLFQKIGLYRQTVAGEMSLRLAIFLGKV